MKLSHITNKILKEDNGDTATVYLYGVIGQRDWWDGEEDITQTAFLKVMKDFERAGKKRLDVRINSVGGSTLHMDGIIALMQSSSMEVHTWVDGLAASAAADIFLAAKKERRHIARNGKLMIHGPSTITYGTAKAHRAAAEMLDVLEAGAIAQMAMDTGLTEEEVKAKFYDGEDHWLTAKQCEENGFVVGVEAYDAESMPAEPEKMTSLELLSFYQAAAPTKETPEPSWLGKLISAIAPQKAAALPVSPPVKEEEMNIDNFKASWGKELPVADVLKFIEEQGFDVVQKATPPEAPPAAPAIDVAKIVADALAPLKATIESMQKQLDTRPGEPFTPAKAVSDPPFEDDKDKPAEVLAAEENFKAALQSQRR